MIGHRKPLAVLLLAAALIVAAVAPPLSASPAPGQAAKHAAQKPVPAAEKPAAEKPAPLPEPSLDEIAALLAGLPGDAPALKALRESPAWTKFAESMDKSWAELEAKRLAPMRLWAEKELFDARIWGKFLFYPFGGPDFMSAFEFFPAAETYVLLGLEFCGRLPRPTEWKGAQAETYWNSLASSLKDFFEKSYFITSHMDATLYGQVEGVLPVIAVFLKRTGHTIIDVKRLEFEGLGEAVESPYDQAKKAFRPYGLNIRFMRPGMPQPKTIIYVSCDLQNKIFAKESSFYMYLDKLVMPPVTTYIKSGSYLLHYAEFSHMREMVLSRSKFILEDDTGIAYKQFKPADWQVRLYGEYAKPIRDFSGVDQPDLQKAYAEGAEIIPKLPFHLGYHWRDSRDALLLAEKRDVPLKSAETAPAPIPGPAPKKK
jgi:hypothetical protein